MENSGNVKIIQYDEWKAEAIKLFGKKARFWRFKCPQCGHIQSIDSVLTHNPQLPEADIRKWINYSCEGRFTPKFGCDWTLGGLFQIHKIEVIFTDSETKKTENIPSFEFDLEK